MQVIISVMRREIGDVISCLPEISEQYRKMYRIEVMVFFLMIRRPPRSTQSRSSAASDVYKRQKPHRDVLPPYAKIDWLHTK